MADNCERAKAAQFDPSTAAVAAWIYTIARNLRIDAARRQSLLTLDDMTEDSRWPGLTRR